MVTGVVGRGAVHDVLQPEVAADWFQSLEEFFLAVEAAVGIVASVRLELDLVCRHLYEPGS